ncbi:MAG: hypothetical protein NT085_01830 [candidate division SR1 bacterium]|nr:hypothetical protein [candidate division SR1 bacterium]
MVFTKKVTKAPAVMVETKKLSAKDSCGMGMGCCGKMKHCFMGILLIVNTILLACVVFHQAHVEADKVGGRDNYKMVQQIYKSDAFKAQQKQQIEQALQMYQGGGAAQQAAVPTTTTTAAPTVAPTVTK